MKKIMIAMAIIIAVLNMHAVKAQETGVQFEKALSWQQILDKAKAEHKYIFVDCYATWCGPCKWMNLNVYPQKAAGEAMNSGFICIRLQMDRTAKDDDSVKSAYALAGQLEKDYDIHAYPTLLFFSPEGVPVHKAVGAMNVDRLIKTSMDVKDPKKQFYTLLKTYQAGQLDFPAMRVLANEAQRLDDKVAAAVAGNYIRNYLDKLSPQEIMTNENVAWLGRFEPYVSVNSTFFKLCLNETAKTDTLMHKKDFAQSWIQTIAYREVLKPMIVEGKQNGKEPDWDKAKKAIDRQFGKAYSTDPVLDAKIDWYYYKKDGPNYAKYIFLQFNKDADKLKSREYARVAYFSFNNAAAAVCTYDSNKADLEGALIWMERLNAARDKPIPEMIDNQASLLYKLGRRDEAIKLQTKAFSIAPNNKDIADDFRKMKAGQPIWSLTGVIGDN